MNTGIQSDKKNLIFLSTLSTKSASREKVCHKSLVMGHIGQCKIAQFSSIPVFIRDCEGWGHVIKHVIKHGKLPQSQCSSGVQPHETPQSQCSSGIARGEHCIDQWQRTSYLR